MHVVTCVRVMAEHDRILELAIHCTLKGGYPTTVQLLSKDKKRAVRKRAITLTA